ncbi:MAG: hypothetical protein MUE80_06415 [Acidobacteria bacterium]|nr:hypothetical protein [Acidobacteriota bacterium]
MNRTLSVIGAIVFLCAAAAPAAAQWAFDVEGGLAWSGYNDVRIPGDGGTLLSLSRELDAANRAFGRLRLSWTFHPRHTLSVLYAPFRFPSSGILDRDIVFAGETFPAGEALRGTYVFNSYRLTWRYGLVRKPRFELGLGLTVKVRDALIALEDAERRGEKTDLGVVPLINFRVLGRLGEKWGVLFEGDALAAPQGRAEDVSLAFWTDLSKTLRLRIGYRLLEGGADNDEVYTFALVNYAFAGLTLTF